MEPTADQLVARAAIHDVLMTYCRGVDRLDEDLVRGCYHPDARDRHGSFDGTVDEYVEWAFGLLRRYDSTFHLLGNELIEFTTQDVAKVESYGVAMHRRAGGRDIDNLITGFRFVDRFERRDLGWRIADRVAVTEWSRVDDASLWFDVADTVLVGRRDRSDPVYQ